MRRKKPSALCLLVAALGIGCTESPTGREQEAGDYFPLTVGNSWVYEVSDLSGAVFRSDTISIKSKRPFKNESVFSLEHRFGENLRVYEYSDSANAVFFFFDSSEWGQRKIFQHAYGSGDSWDTPDGAYTSTFIGRFAGPFGEFDACYRLDSSMPNGFSDWWILAPDIGVVQKSVNGFLYDLRRFRAGPG